MNKKILILATKDGPYSYMALQYLIKNGIKIFGVALDEKGVGEKSVQIWNERTAGNIKVGNIFEFESPSTPFFIFKSHAHKEFEAFVRDHGIDLLVNAGTPNILRQNILDAPKMGVLNVHPSILPKYRGCTTMEWSIYNDDPVGNTAHFMTAGIDEGPIIVQESYNFTKKDKYTDIRSKLYLKNVELMAKAIEKIVNNDLTPEKLAPQEDGHYWNVIDQDKIETVKMKLANGQYKYQY